MDYRKYIALKKEAWIGTKVICQADGEIYTVVDVDHNGMLLIDKKAKYTDTTAVETYMVQEV